MGRSSALDIAQVRQLLQRLTRANVPGVVELAAREFADARSHGFGELPIQRLLTLEQVVALAEIRPSLQQETPWVQAVLARLALPAHVDGETDLGARREQLDAVWSFVEALAPSFNGLKVQVLQQRLELDRRLGALDRARFLLYLGLPRAAAYVEPGWLRRFSSEQIARPGQRAFAGFDPIGDDEALVRAYLEHFLAQEGVEAFAEHIRRDWLLVEQATARLLAGDPETRRWTAMLAEDALAALRSAWRSSSRRATLGASPRTRRWRSRWSSRTSPSLRSRSSGSTRSRTSSRAGEVDTSLDLDGMVAGDERRVRVDAPPIQRTRLSIELPGCARGGTYVVEILGNGKSSRALIRKGALRHTVRIGAAGPTLSVFDEAGHLLRDARVWMGGREYAPREDGEISIPFSTSPSQAPMLLVHGDLAQREVLDHVAESYRLEAGIHLETQALVAGKSARFLIRPTLSVAAATAPIALLDEPRVEITVTDLGGVASTRIEPVALRDDAEAVVEIRVPEDAAHLGVRLRGQVRAASTAQTIDLVDGAEAAINRCTAAIGPRSCTWPPPRPGTSSICSASRASRARAGHRCRDQARGRQARGDGHALDRRARADRARAAARRRARHRGARGVVALARHERARGRVGRGRRDDHPARAALRGGGRSPSCGVAERGPRRRGVARSHRPGAPRSARAGDRRPRAGALPARLPRPARGDPDRGRAARERGRERRGGGAVARRAVAAAAADPRARRLGIGARRPPLGRRAGHARPRDRHALPAFTGAAADAPAGAARGGDAGRARGDLALRLRPRHRRRAPLHPRSALGRAPPQGAAGEAELAAQPLGAAGHLDRAPGGRRRGAYAASKARMAPARASAELRKGRTARLKAASRRSISSRSRRWCSPTSAPTRTGSCASRSAISARPRWSGSSSSIRR